jgi:hypothetical protein
MTACEGCGAWACVSVRGTVRYCLRCWWLLRSGKWDGRPATA